LASPACGVDRDAAQIDAALIASRTGFHFFLPAVS
jgi:hypothetical protein